MTCVFAYQHNYEHDHRSAHASRPVPVRPIIQEGRLVPPDEAKLPGVIHAMNLPPAVSHQNLMTAHELPDV